MSDDLREAVRDRLDAIGLPAADLCDADAVLALLRERGALVPEAGNRYVVIVIRQAGTQFGYRAGICVARSGDEAVGMYMREMNRVDPEATFSQPAFINLANPPALPAAPAPTTGGKNA